MSLTSSVIRSVWKGLRKEFEDTLARITGHNEELKDIALAEHMVGMHDFRIGSNTLQSFIPSDTILEQIKAYKLAEQYKDGTSRITRRCAKIPN